MVVEKEMEDSWEEVVVVAATAVIVVLVESPYRRTKGET